VHDILTSAIDNLPIIPSPCVLNKVDVLTDEDQVRSSSVETATDQPSIQVDSEATTNELIPSSEFQDSSDPTLTSTVSEVAKETAPELAEVFVNSPALQPEYNTPVPISEAVSNEIATVVSSAAVSLVEDAISSSRAEPSVPTPADKIVKAPTLFSSADASIALPADGSAVATDIKVEVNEEVKKTGSNLFGFEVKPFSWDE